MLVTLDNRIRLPKTGLPPVLWKKIKKEFKYANPDYFKKQNMGFWVGDVQRYIATFKLEDGGKTLTLPRGAYNRVMGMLDAHGVDYAIQDNRYKGPQVEYQFAPDFELRPYQEEAIDAIFKHETCLLEKAAGSGKTEVVLGAIARAGLRAGIIVHNKLLQRQWIRRIEKRLGIPAREIGRIGGGGKARVGDRITVMLQRSALSRLPLIKEVFGFLVLDEAHHASARTFLELIDALASYYRVGGSATIKRRDLKHFLTYDLFGDVAYKIDRQELVDLGYLTGITVHVVHTNFYMDYQNHDALEILLAKGLVDHEEMSAKERRKIAAKMGWPDNDYNQYLDEATSDNDRNNLIFHWVREELDKGNKAIIFTKRRHHCNVWAERLQKIGVPIVILWGTRGATERRRQERDLDRLKRGDVRVGIGTVLDEGLDMPVVEAGFITYRNASNPGQLEQQAGRLARLFSGKTEGRLYYFHDHRISKFNGDVRALKRRFKKVVVHERTKRRKAVKKKRSA